MIIVPQFFASASSLRKRWLFVLSTLVYKRSAQGRAYFRDQAANTHNGYCTTTILVFPEDQVISGSSSLGSLSNIKPRIGGLRGSTLSQYMILGAPPVYYGVSMFPTLLRRTGQDGLKVLPIRPGPRLSN